MKFQESNCATIERPRLVFVYFLVNDGEVVYVGQTKCGLSRPAQHKDKDFDTIYAMYCKPDELDELEDKYIMKYMPKYNKQPNYNINISLNRLKEMAKKDTGNSSVNLWTIKRAMRNLDIRPYLIETTPFVKRDQAEEIIQYIRDTNGTARSAS